MKEVTLYGGTIDSCLKDLRKMAANDESGEVLNDGNPDAQWDKMLPLDEKYPKSIIELANIVQSNVHPTQKPVDLLRYLIRTYTDVGGSSGLVHRQRHYRRRLREGEAPLHRLRVEQRIFRHRREADMGGTAPVDALLSAPKRNNILTIYRFRRNDIPFDFSPYSGHSDRKLK